VLCDERATTAIAFLRRAVDFYRAHGITVERLMTDNGSAYRSTVHALACKTLRIRHIRTSAYRPRTNGKAERLSARCSAPAPTRTEAADRSPAVPEGVATQYRTIEEEVGAEGGDQIKGPWQVSYIVEPAEGWFERRGGELRFREPAEGETHHLEIIPREASTGRVVPNVPVTLEVLDEQGERVDEKRLSPYYAEFFHYADNFTLPEAGEYALRARVEAPNLRLHGEESEGPPLSEGVEVEFDGVRSSRSDGRGASSSKGRSAQRRPAPPTDGNRGERSSASNVRPRE